MTDDARRPWDALPSETDAQFHAFRCYRDLGPARSRDKAWRVYAAERGLKGVTPSSTFQEWQRHNKWVERALAYDRHEDRVRLETRMRLAETARVEAASYGVDIVDRLLVMASGQRLPGADNMKDADIIRASKLLLDVAGVTTHRIELAGDENQPLTVAAIVADADTATAEELVEQYKAMRRGHRAPEGE